MYIDKRRKTVTYNDIRALIREEWPERQQLSLPLVEFSRCGDVKVLIPQDRFRVTEYWGLIPKDRRFMFEA